MRVLVPIDLPDGARVKHVVVETTSGDWQMVPPAAPVRLVAEDHPARPARRPRWEYRIIGVAEMGAGRTEPKVAEQVCNGLGAEGWEIVHVNRGGVWFKRPLLL